MFRRLPSGDCPRNLASHMPLAGSDAGSRVAMLFFRAQEWSPLQSSSFPAALLASGLITAVAQILVRPVQGRSNREMDNQREHRSAILESSEEKFRLASGNSGPNNGIRS